MTAARERSDAAAAAGPVIRPYRPADRDANARICQLTASCGGDETGVYSDDTLKTEEYELP